MSSESEDDCYGNVVKTLHSLKNKFQEDKLESAKLLNTSQENETVSKTESRNAAPNNEFDSTISDDEEIDKIIALNSQRTTRSTRASNRSVKNNNPANTTQTPTRGRGRGRGRKRKQDPPDCSASACCTATTSTSPTTSTTCPTTSSTCPDAPSTVTTNTSASSRNSVTASSVNPWTLSARRRGGRRRGARGGRRPISNILDAFLQTYSIGNCEEYDDMSNNVQLFSKSNKTQVAQEAQVADDIFDENEELSVKVIWQSVDIVKFTIRKYQKISQIFEHFAKQTESSVDKLLFTYNDKILKPDDTPDTINYSIAKFIDGGIVSNTVPLLASNTESKPVDGIKIKFQYPNSKRAFEVYVSEDEQMSVSMMKCAEHMEVPIKRLKFEFDGDCITGQMTAKELEMEGGECVDVKIIS